MHDGAHQEIVDEPPIPRASANESGRGPKAYLRAESD
jgi:hypothetical protein